MLERKSSPLPEVTFRNAVESYGGSLILQLLSEGQLEVSDLAINAAIVFFFYATYLCLRQISLHATIRTPGEPKYSHRLTREQEEELYAWMDQSQD